MQKLQVVGLFVMVAVVSVVVGVWLWRRSVVPSEVVATARDIRHAAALVKIQDIPGKGKGVVALTHIPAWTMVGPYPGKVYTIEEHERLKEAGIIDDEYAVEFWSGRVGDKILEDRILNPRMHGGFLPRYATAVAPFVNEPDVNVKPSLVWVWNFPNRRIEMWTRRDVRPGEELSICYGEYYERSYDTKCMEDEPTRRVIGSPDQKVPKEWHDVIVKNRVPAT